MNKTVDLFMMMGQSNMAGRGISDSLHPETCPCVTAGAGYEFRAVTDPERLYEMAEPFGRHENRDGGINDGDMKTGSMVSAFTNAYYEGNGHVPVVAVSAAKGGSHLLQWQPDSPEGYLPDAMDRMKTAVKYLADNGYTIRHKFMLWCQGETDADKNTSDENYVKLLNTVLCNMFSLGIEKCFMVRIGKYNGDKNKNLYDGMIALQDKIAQTDERVVMVSMLFSEMRERGLMKDAYHYFQSAYNETGTDAGKNTAEFVRTNF